MCWPDPTFLFDVYGPDLLGEPWALWFLLPMVTCQSPILPIRGSHEITYVPSRVLYPGTSLRGEALFKEVEGSREGPDSLRLVGPTRTKGDPRNGLRESARQRNPRSPPRHLCLFGDSLAWCNNRQMSS